MNKSENNRLDFSILTPIEADGVIDEKRYELTRKPSARSFDFSIPM